MRTEIRANAGGHARIAFQCDMAESEISPDPIYTCPSMTIVWWHWLVAGLILVLLEMAASGGFYVICFGVAALAIGSLHLFGLAGPLWTQLLLFSLLSIGSLLMFRGPLIRWLKLDAGSADVDSLRGEIGFAQDDMPAGQI